MSLREQFEAWIKIDQPHMFAYNPMLFEDDKVRGKMWRAYQAGHAASGRDELLKACEYMEEVLRYAGGEDGKAYGMVTAVIKKARGES